MSQSSEQNNDLYHRTNSHGDLAKLATSALWSLGEALMNSITQPYDIEDDESKSDIQDYSETEIEDSDQNTKQDLKDTTIRSDPLYIISKSGQTQIFFNSLTQDQNTTPERLNICITNLIINFQIHQDKIIALYDLYNIKQFIESKRDLLNNTITNIQRINSKALEIIKQLSQEEMHTLQSQYSSLYNTFHDSIIQISKNDNTESNLPQNTTQDNEVESIVQHIAISGENQGSDTESEGDWQLFCN